MWTKTIFVVQTMATDGNCHVACMAYEHLEPAIELAMTYASEGSSVKRWDNDLNTGLGMWTVGRIFSEVVVSEVPFINVHSQQWSE